MRDFPSKTMSASDSLMDILDFFIVRHTVEVIAMGLPSTKIPPHPSFIAGQIREYRYFFLILAPRPRSELTVVCGGWERCAPDYRIDREDFEFYGLEYVARGKGLLTVDGIEHKLLPGSVFAYKPF